MRTIVIFSGAGLSTESGIPTFRDANGLWENHKIEDVGCHEAWQRDPEMVLRFYKERYEKLSVCEPNEAHKAIARLQEKFKVVNYTQNVDDLLERAGCKNVLHLHGSLGWAKCEKHRDIPTLDGDINFRCNYKTAIKKPIQMGDLCRLCNCQMRPDVVLFGEAVDIPFSQIFDYVYEMEENGVFICVGTSIQVYPAGQLVGIFSKLKNKYIVDTKPLMVPGYTLVTGRASVEIPQLVDELMK